MRTLLTTALAAAALTTLPASAVAAHQAADSARVTAPGSLVYVKDFNVWVSRTDGTGARRITTDGTSAHQYHSPSQADTGVVVAAKDERIVRMDAFGRVLTVLDPPGLKNSAGSTMDGTPSSVAISPDGTLIAYTHVEQGCPPGIPCATRFATAYTAADRVTDPATYGVTYGNDPSWLGNDRTVQGGGQIPDVRVHVLGQPSPPRWFADSQIESPGEELTDPAISRDARWVAAIRGWGSETNLVWAEADGDLTGPPELWCRTNVEPIAEPAFSADSSTLAWATAQGIWMESDVEGCAQPTLVVRGASEPSFSAAPFADGSAPVNTKAPRVAGSPRVGRTVTATTGTWRGATSYGYQWLRNGRVIPRATTATYLLPAKDLGRAISVRVTATGPGGTATATSAPVVVT